MNVTKPQAVITRSRYHEWKELNDRIAYLEVTKPQAVITRSSYKTICDRIDKGVESQNRKRSSQGRAELVM